MKKLVLFSSLIFIATLMVNVYGVQAKDLLLMGVLHDKLVVIDMEKDEIRDIISLKGKKLTALTWDPKNLNRVYCVTDWAQQIEIIDLAQKKVITSFRLGKGDIKTRSLDLEVDPRNLHHLYSLTLRQEWKRDEIITLSPEVMVIDVETKEVIREFEIPTAISSIVFSTDGKELYAIGRDIYVFNPENGQIINYIGLGHPTVDGVPPQILLQLLKNHEQSRMISIVTGSMNPFNNNSYHGMVLLDLDKNSNESWRFITELSHLFGLGFCVVSPDRKYAYGAFNQLVKVDLLKGMITKTRPLNHSYAFSNISSDGHKVYVGGQFGNILVCNAETLETIKDISLPADPGVTFMRVQTR